MSRREKVEAARHKELVGYIRAFIPILMVVAGAYLYSRTVVVLSSYWQELELIGESPYYVYRPYAGWGILLIVIGVLWLSFETINLLRQRRIQD